MGLRREVFWGICFAAILVLAWIAYRPGLTGGFIFDDYANLPQLGANGRVDNGTALVRYLTSGAADPTGRPIAMASFLIDANDWPADPAPFKRTSVLFHLLNGLLLACVLLALGRRLPLAEPVARKAALLGAGIWLLHPLLVSSTLYIVQREAMLPATFTLAAMLAWMRARDALVEGRQVRAVIGLTLAAGLGTLLATLCKANGALLPLLLLCCEATVLRRQEIPTPALRRTHRLAVAVLLVLPSLLLAAWMVSEIPFSIQSAKDIRDWTMGQRLLTEPRALTGYLGLWLIPHADSSGLFNDAFTASRDWLHPWTTLPCIAIVLGLLWTGFTQRRKHPALALGLLFFFAAHLMESTWLPLELYFEHRNYLPMLLLSWPFAIVLVQEGPRAGARLALGAGILAVLALLTFSRASLWGNPYLQAIQWARQNPDSMRAQATAAQFEISQGRPDLAAVRLRHELLTHPDDIQISINLIGAECRTGGAQPGTLAAAQAGLQRTRTGAELGFSWLTDAIDIARNQQCPGLDFPAVESLVRAARANAQWRNLPTRQQDLDHLEGMLALAEGDPQRAVTLFDRSLAIDPKPEGVLEQAALLGAAGRPELALEHLKRVGNYQAKVNPSEGMPAVHAWLLNRQHYWENEIVHLRATLEDDLKHQPAAKAAASPP